MGYLYGAPGVLWAHEFMVTSNLEPRIELTLSNSVDLIFKAVENRRTKERLQGGAHWLASPTP
jgi:hypothetical protein